MPLAESEKDEQEFHKMESGTELELAQRSFDLLVFEAREREKEIPASRSEDSKAGIRWA